MSSVNHADGAILGLKIMYRAVGEDEWSVFASLDELDPPEPEEEGDASFPTDPAVLAADLAMSVPDLYSPFLWREERQHWPLPAVWRQEVYDVVSGDLVASAEYTQEDSPAAGEFSHLRWVVSYFDAENARWISGSGGREERGILEEAYRLSPWRRGDGEGLGRRCRVPDDCAAPGTEAARYRPVASRNLGWNRGFRYRVNGIAMVGDRQAARLSRCASPLIITATPSR